MFRLLFLSALLFFVAYGVYSFFSKHLGGNKNRHRQSQDNAQKQNSTPKHFNENIGEYVPYEEVKEEDK